MGLFLIIMKVANIIKNTKGICIMQRLLVSGLIILILLLRGITLQAAEDAITIMKFDFNRDNNYIRYIEKYQGEIRPDDQIIIPAFSFSNQAQAIVTRLDKFEGRKDVLRWENEAGWLEWEIQVPESGLYNIAMEYYPLNKNGRNLEVELMIDGDYPFNEARSFIFSRVWKDATGIKQDNRGNDIRPDQVEVPGWNEDFFKDQDGLFNEPYLFYFSAGKHTLRLIAVREKFVIDKIKIMQRETLPTYQEYQSSISAELKDDKTKPDILVKIQGEDTLYKSSPTLYPVYDRSSPATEPNHHAQIRLNTIGQTNWRFPGQWISWQVEVPRDGFYKLGIKYRQNFLRGFYTTRRIYIDGKVPFAELENVKFPYDVHWQMKVPGNKEPYLIYLKKGTHEIKMEVVLGDFAETLRNMQDAVFEMNYLYRKIIMITGVSPDPYRDYFLEEEIPDLLPRFRRISNMLKVQKGRIERLTGNQGSEAALLEMIYHQLDSLAEIPETINTRLDRYKSNVSSLSAWILKMKEQPLEIDYLILASPEVEMPTVQANIWEKLAFRGKAFIASFFQDYTSIGNVYDKEKAITVWISAGRDQAQVLKNLIDNEFIPETGIPVNLKLVQQALVQATLAGKGPDIAIGFGRDQPINLAIRGAVVDLSQFEDFEEVTRRFAPTAMVPYEFQGGYYALPVQQHFNMLFYRKDVFQELGLQPPETWEDFYDIIPVIQRNNMEIGLYNNAGSLGQNTVYGTRLFTYGLNTIFSALVLQRGGRFYKEDHTATAFDEPEALEAFKEWTGFYTRYTFPFSFDFYNRFRTGEMPLGIMPYVNYNLLAVGAPEIRNMWGMVPIPGTRKENGEIDRSQSGMGNAVLMLKTIKNKEAGWEFIKWWTSAEIQMKYGRGLETLVGPAARYDTANVEAFKQLPWSKKEQEVLLQQWFEVQEIPEIPGSYYTIRGLENAFRTVVFDWENPRETFDYWTKQINDEIKRKRREFGLDY
jgi:ABC-type glycerol-3-phosphate transport system substrate-binding protein